MITCTNSTVYTRVWPGIWASYNHLLHDEYNSIQCILGVQVRNNITTQSCYSGVLHVTTSKEAWDKLCEHYEGKGKQSMAYLIGELF